MTTTVTMAFEGETIVLPLAKLLPTKTLPKGMKTNAKYKDIEASYRVVGSVEPLVVWRQRDDDTYLLLEGHKRLAVLQDAGATEAECIVSTDDEAYTYNTWVSRLAPVQANKMILRALDAGVADVRLAAALNRSPTTIRMSRTMLKDISAEALELLKDKPVATAVFALLKHVHPLRQIDMAELMCKTKNFTKSYAAGLVSRTATDMMAENAPPKRPARPKPEDIARMEVELQALERDILQVDESFGRDVVNLTIARGYVKKLLENTKVVKYLAAKHADVLTEFQRIQEAASLT
jgi:ParB-like chromosome segregation protein Spo0J